MKNGNNWILLRGLGRGSIHWGSLPRKWIEKFPEANLELLDLPGNGWRNDEVSPSKIVEYVHDLRFHSQILKNYGKANLLSMSLGAMVAISWADLFPNEVESALLINTSSSMSWPWDRIALNSLLPMVLSQFNRDHSDFENKVYSIVSNTQVVQKEFLIPFTEERKNHPVSLLNLIRQLKAARGFRAPNPTSDLASKLVFLGCPKDRFVSFRCTKKMANYYQSKIHVHPTAGHDIPIDDPDWVLNLLGEY